MVKCVAQRVRLGRDAQALYIDTYACLSVSEECARNQATLMQETVAAAGIVSDTEGAKPDTDTFWGLSWMCAPLLGGPRRGVMDGNIVCALDYVLARGRRVTGAEVERLLGHLLSAMLLRRELISVFCYIWKFIRESYKRRQPLWPCVRRELVHARALLPLARAEGYQEWAEDVFVFDASKTGFRGDAPVDVCGPGERHRGVCVNAPGSQGLLPPSGGPHPPRCGRRSGG